MNFVVTRYLKQAEGVDYKRLPLGYFFEKKFSRAEDCAEIPCALTCIKRDKYNVLEMKCS